MRSTRWAVALVLVAACDAKLPDPDSPGGRIYAARCADGCHRLYAPNLMTYEMWKITVDRMQSELARRSAGPLTGEEKAVVLEYLRAHSHSADGQAER